MNDEAADHLSQLLEVAQQEEVTALRGITLSDFHTAPADDEWTVT